ncbi:hypothetical protein EOK75_17185 (plasmid) [Pseudorhodobacter turbinis]|uniref:Uncharacterized protein n=1 Tax=Pseudorhodobacter turbinis TaxID=2500533 RepID=A0A4P8EK76_9RHOB|nr:hypothetical protein [Pseudorhodobacter turbinis]QCO57447.1 hypothetical protein EOK75_17185 [Pseudorhodobacter turbinis]
MARQSTLLSNGYKGAKGDTGDTGDSANIIKYTTSAVLTGTTPSVDAGARDAYTLTTSGNTTFTFTGAPVAPEVCSVTLILTGGGTHTITFPASVKWDEGEAPTDIASASTDIYTFMTVNGGTTWFGFQAGRSMA